jgi:V-type H+-transporting ATPase subunit A
MYAMFVKNSLQHSQDHIYELEFGGDKTLYTMIQLWPVRTPRPVVKKHLMDTPFLTGQRVLDAIAPYEFIFLL